MSEAQGHRPHGKKFDEQQRVLVALQTLHRERSEARREMRAEIERAYEAKLYNLKLEEAKLMIEGFDLGVSKSKLGRAIGTTDWKTVNEMLDLGRSMLPVAEELVVPYEWSERHTTVNGYYWYLRVEGDDHKITEPGFEGEGYLRFVDNAGIVMWVGGKPDEAAQKWAEENPPE